MSTIVTRAGKGTPLTNTEVDSNFTNLNDEKLENLTSTDGSISISGTGGSRNLSVTSAGAATSLTTTVRNATGSTLSKGTVVYINGATGQIPTVAKAIATSDATSAQTLGLIAADISNNSNGTVIMVGVLSGLDTSSFSDGQQLYLSPTTAGTFTSTKPYAPDHLVYVGVVEYAHVTQGEILVKVQNGYELDEIHDVQITGTPLAGSLIIRDATASLWKNARLTAGTNVTITNADGAITINAADQYVGTVTSVGGTGTVNGITLTGTVTSSGSLTLGGTLSGVSLTSQVTGTLPVANGGTGATTLTANNVILGNGGSAVQFVAPGSSGNVLTSNGTTWSSAVLPAGGLTYVVKTSNYTTQDKEGVLADTSGGAFTVTLPATPATGAQVVVADAGSAWGTNNLTIGRNGSTIGGLAENLVCNITGASVQLVYDGSTWEVYAQIGGNGGTAVTLTDVQTLTNKTINGASNTLTVRLANDVTGTLPVANGGTGATTLTANNVILGNGTSAVQVVAPGTTGNVLTSDGTTWTSATPSGAIGSTLFLWTACV